MQYACYKIHPTAKMIKEASPFCTVWTVGGREEGKEAERQAVEYIEVDSAEMFKEVDIHDEYIRRVTTLTDWFELITEQYADCSDEFRDNLIIYSEMIREVQNARAAHDPVSLFIKQSIKQRERAWGLYKIISDCPTSVY
tara:strand:+ start:369 stop:788 length:420 start_codon:yes stop_codon:yes gene_type:complete